MPGGHLFKRMCSGGGYCCRCVYYSMATFNHLTDMAKTKKQAEPLSLKNRRKFKNKTTYLAAMRRQLKQILMLQTEFLEHSEDLPHGVSLRVAMSKAHAAQARTRGSKVWGKY